MIPKIIHYCWFGNNEKPGLVKDCIESWKTHLPDYEIKEWNETNSKLDSKFVKKAYKLKKWAFVSDYVRLQKVYEYGGIYLDTDMLLVKNLDELLKNKMFIGIEDESTINAAIFGATIKHPFVYKILEKYSNLKIGGFVNLFSIAIPKIITEIFKKTYNYNDLFLSKIEKEDIVIFPIEYFYALPSNKSSDKVNYRNYLTKNSYAVHLWNASWVDFNEFQYIRARKYGRGFVELVKNVNHEQNINYKYLRKILSAIKESVLKPKQ
ncbi:glycosyltransferase [Polaribacter sp. Q13]|uniref:glycosyltransferase n=1 Tax=Polaribacter sp. Q13 TaxID=2806551 RepID=UPI00193BADBC|nr:glycosyltransferase [Polaribacter sp. Q13]QVY65786.1 glycosyl transferase [Polaribacter sp. Q13]